MSEVTNLVRMDLWKIASLGKNLAVYVVVLLVFFQFQMGLVAPVLLLYLTTYILAYYDEQSKGVCLTGTLPVTRTQQVQANYLLDLAVLAAALALGAAAFWVGQLLGIGGGQPPEQLWLMFVVGAVFIAVAQPMLLLFGPLKARWWIFGFYFVMFGAVAALASLTAEAPAWAWALVGGRLAPALGVALGWAALLVSYLAAARCYRRREFSD